MTDHADNADHPDTADQEGAKDVAEQTISCLVAGAVIVTLARHQDLFEMTMIGSTTSTQNFDLWQ